MSLTQGSQMPDVTTTQTQSTTTPSWYTDYLQNIANQGNTAADNAQFVGVQPMQQQSYDLAKSNVGNYQPTLNTATGALGSAINSTSPLAAANPYLTSAANPTYNTVQNYMNPYTQQVVSQIGDLAQQNIMQNVAPQTNAGIVGSGQFGSQRGAQALGQTLANYGQQTTAAQTGALQKGYSDAMANAQAQAALQAQIGQTAGNLASAGQQNLNNSAQIGGQLATTTQNLGLGDVNALNTLGTQQQQIAQAEQLFPLQMAQAKAGLLQGAQIPTSSTSTYTGPIPGAYQNAPLSTGLGALTSLGSLFSSGVGGTSAVKGISDWLSGLGGSSNPGYTNPNSLATSNPNGAMDAVSGAPDYSYQMPTTGVTSVDNPTTAALASAYGQG